MSEEFDLKKAYNELNELIILGDIQVSADLKQVFNIFVNRLKIIINFDAIALFLYDETQERPFSCSLQMSFENYLRLPNFFQVMEELYIWVLNKDSNVFFPSEIAPGLNDLYVPLSIFGNKLGILHIITATDPLNFTQHQNVVLTIFTNQISKSLQYFQMIEQEKETYTNLLQHEKINMLGYIMSGIIHEINTPLTSIIGYSNLILEHCQDVDTLQNINLNYLLGSASILSKESIRVSNIVKNLLKFVHKGTPDLQRDSIDLNKILLTVLDLLQYNFKIHQVTVETKLEVGLPAILGDGTQLQQVFFNILTNAEQALIAQNSSLHPTIYIETWSEQDKVYVIIKDNGPGISPQNLTKIFDPFFTTKELEKGTGLGLSLCLKTISEHQGKISADNLPTGGAVFSIMLPVLKIKQQLPIKSKPEDKIKPRDRQKIKARILIVDDETTILQLLLHILAQDGHQVECASSGQEACQMLLASHDYQVVIMDMHLIDLTGLDLFEFVKTHTPYLQQNIIFLTGAVVDSQILSVAESNHLKCLFKPFYPQEVLALVQKVLKQNRERLVT